MVNDDEVFLLNAVFDSHEDTSLKKYVRKKIGI